MQEGIHTLHVHAWDNTDNARGDAGNEKDWTFGPYMLDTVAPSITLTTPPTSTWLINPPPITWSITDATSGPDNSRTQVIWDNGSTGGTIPEGKHSVTITAFDIAGNPTTTTAGPFWVDNTPPQLSASLTPNPEGTNGWYWSAPTLTINAQDGGSDVASVTYQIDDEAVQPYTAPVVLSIEGSHTITVQACDKARDVAGNVAGNVTTATLPLKLDSTPPEKPAIVAPGQWGSTGVLAASWSAREYESGIAEYDFAIGSSPGGEEILPRTSTGTQPFAFVPNLLLTMGQSYYFTVWAKNNAGKWCLAPGTSAPITITALNGLDGAGALLSSCGTGDIPWNEYRTNTSHMGLVDQMGHIVGFTSTSGEYTVLHGVGEKLDTDYSVPAPTDPAAARVRRSDNYAICDVMGQFAVGESASANYGIEHGYLHGAEGAVNQAPTIDQLPDQDVPENAPPMTVKLTGISAEDDGQAMTITAQSDTPGILPDPAVSYTSPQDTATLTFQPLADQIGSAIITVTVQDDGGTANGGVDLATMYFTVNVNLVNDAPTLDAIPDQYVVENCGAKTVTLTGIGPGGTGEEIWQTVTVSATSDTPALILAPQVEYTPGEATGTLTFTPAANKTGTAHITVIVQDDGGTAYGGVDITMRSFTVTVGFVNTAPTLTSISNLTINENAGTQTVNLTGISPGDADDAGQALSITATSNNPTLIPNLTVTYVSPQATGTLTFTPALDHYGSASLTVTLKDDGGTANGGVDTITRSFTVTVNLVNDAPTLGVIADQVCEVDSGVQTVTLTGIGPGGTGEESWQAVTVTAVSSNSTLIPTPTVAGSGATRTLSYRPAAGQSGAATITVTAKDNGGTANGGVDTTARTFTVTVMRHQPDLWLRNAGEVSFTGVGGYSADGTGQTKAQTVPSIGKATYYFAIRNDGGGDDTFTIKGTLDVAGWTASFFTTDAQGNMPAPISGIAGGWSTGVMTAGQVRYLKVDITWAGPVGSPTACTLTLTATSAASPAKTDVVKAVTSLRRGSDLSIHGTGDSGYLGSGVFNLSGTGQTSSINLTGASTTYSVHVTNVDVATDTITLKAPAIAAGWKARYLLSPSNTDITSKVNSASGWTSTAMAAQGMFTVLVVVNPNAYVKLNGYAIVTLTATSGNDTGNQDVVKAVTTRK